jgi:proteasome lid subunit RPN8/RPN11
MDLWEINDDDDVEEEEEDVALSYQTHPDSRTNSASYPLGLELFPQG